MERTDSDLSLRYTFAPGTLDPSEFFSSASKATSGLMKLETALLFPLDGISIELRLQAIEEASLRAYFLRKLKTALQVVDDGALRSGEMKKVVGIFLANMRLVTLEWLTQHPLLEDHRQIEPLHKLLEHQASRTEVVLLQPRRRLKTIEVIRSVQQIASSRIAPNQEIVIEDTSARVKVPQPIDFGDKTIDEALSAKEVERELDQILLVKKPDFLGSANWEFRSGDGAITASIADTEWLARFQNAEIDVPPGSALVARLQHKTFLDSNGNPTSTRTSVLAVRAVILPGGDQTQFDFGK